MNYLKTYAQLLRLPNVFTAWADVLMGGIALTAIWRSPNELRDIIIAPAGALALLASSCLYSAGMVLNDFFDAEVDRRERPHRPIPSGRISRSTAGILGFSLLAGGWILAIGWVDWSVVPGIVSPAMQGIVPLPGLFNRVGFWVGGALASAILLYNGVTKDTWFGPINMGLCRSLNVGLGLSLLGDAGLWGLFLNLAPVVGVYIVGVTLFARKEVTESPRASLVAASVILLLAVLLALMLLVWPEWLHLKERPHLYLYPVLLAGWSLIIAIPITRAIHTPSPQRVQTAVKTCILGLIGLDAILAFGVVGWPGLLILALLIPALVLGRWVYST